jgi:hypothetical protein
MKAKINDKGRVVWIGFGDGENWVSFPDNIPSDNDPDTSLHYDRGADEWGMR